MWRPTLGLIDFKNSYFSLGTTRNNRPLHSKFFGIHYKGGLKVTRLPVRRRFLGGMPFKYSSPVVVVVVIIEYLFEARLVTY